jgi:isopentenyl-diphosphate delta-isomerase type 1
METNMPLDNQAELFYWVNENDQVLGSISRKAAHADRSKIHRSVFIILQNDQQEVLLQKRSLKKDTHPGKWTVAASGHVTFGQTYDEAAYRELAEEIGVHGVELKLVKKHYFAMQNEQEIASIYTGHFNEIPTNIDADEVSEVRWLTLSQLQEWFSKDALTPMAGKLLVLLGYIKN